MRTAIMILAICGPAFAPQDEAEEVTNAAKKSLEKENYSFKGDLLVDMPAFGGGEEQEPEPMKFEGKHDKEAGTHILTATQEIAMFDGKTVTRPRAEWRVEDPDEEGRPRGGRRFGMGGFMGRMFTRDFKLPHEDLKNLEEQFDDVEKTDKTDTVGETECTVYKADFTADAAEDMIPDNRMLERMGDTEISATGKFWIDGEGNLCKYQVALKIEGSFGPNDFEVTATRTIVLYDIGSTEVKIPAGAKKAVQDKDY